MPSDVQISVGADTSQFATGMASIQSVVQRTSADVTRYFSSAFVGTAALGSLVAILEKIHEIHHESSRFNVDAEALQKIAIPAKELGVNMEQVARAMNAAQLAGVKAAQGDEKMVSALRELNISVLDFNNLSADQKILAVAEAYEKSTKSADDYAAVAQILGRRFGTELIPAFEGIIRAARDGTSNLEIFTRSQIQAGEAAYRLYEILKQIGLVQIAGPLLVGIVRVGGALTDAAVAASSLLGYLARLAQLDFKGAAGFGQNIIDVFTLKGPGFKGVQNILNPPPRPGGTAGAGLGEEIGGFTGGIGGGRGGGGISDFDQLEAKREANRLAQLGTEQKLNDLVAQRTNLQEQLDDITIDAEHELFTDREKSFELENQIAELTGQIVPLNQQISDQKAQQALDDEKAVAAIKLKIAESQGQMAVQELINQGRAEEADLLKIALDYEHDIQEALNTANLAREQGDEIIAKENEKLAQQLRLQEEQALIARQQADAARAESRPGWVQTATGWRPTAAGPGQVIGGWGTSPFSMPDFFRFYNPTTGQFDQAAMERFQLRRQAANLRWQASGSQVLPASMRAGGEFGTDFWSQIELSQRQADFTRRQEAAQRQSSLNFANILDELAAGRMPSAAMWLAGLAGPSAWSGGGANVQVAQLATQISLLQQQLDKLTHIDANLTPRPGGI